MKIYNGVDICVSPSGDLSIDSNGDFKLTTGPGVLKQDISFRVRTNAGEFIPHPEVGANLDSLIGEPNDRTTAKNGEAQIIHSLIYDGMIANMDLFVKAVPINNESVVYYVFVNNGGQQINVTPEVIFNAMTGLTNTPGV